MAIFRNVSDDTVQIWVNFVLKTVEPDSTLEVPEDMAESVALANAYWSRVDEPPAAVEPVVPVDESPAPVAE